MIEEIQEMLYDDVDEEPLKLQATVGVKNAASLFGQFGG